MPKIEKKQKKIDKSENNISNRIDELDERRRVILKCIIKTYLDTGEPVGSRTISKLIDMDISSATIRNEMSDLFDLGYILQPHTSAGRIPSDKGYRFYVDNLMQENAIEIKNIKAEMTARVDRLEDTLKGLVQSLANNTNYAALIKGPTISNNIIKYVQISNIEEKKILVVVVAEGNIVKTNIVDIEKVISPQDIIDLQLVLNNILTGKTVSDVQVFDFNKEIKDSIKQKNIVISIIEAIKKILSEEQPENQIYTSGANNFFKYKDFVEKEKVSSLVEAFEQKNELAKLVSNVSKKQEETAVNVYIGEETNLESMKDCSVVTANCDFGNGMKGTIGIVGPKRMDYEKVLKAFKNVFQTAKKELE